MCPCTLVFYISVFQTAFKIEKKPQTHLLTPFSHFLCSMKVNVWDNVYMRKALHSVGTTYLLPIKDTEQPLLLGSRQYYWPHVNSLQSVDTNATGYSLLIFTFWPWMTITVPIRSALTAGGRSCFCPANQYIYTGGNCWSHQPTEQTWWGTETPNVYKKHKLRPHHC